MDRKKTQVCELLNQCKSLSARRAWIEKEEQMKEESIPEGRSPQGERG